MSWGHCSGMLLSVTPSRAVDSALWTAAPLCQTVTEKPRFKNLWRENLTDSGCWGRTSQFPVEKDDKLIKSMDQNILNVLKVEAEAVVFLKRSNVSSQLWVVSFAAAIAFWEIIAGKMAKKTERAQVPAVYRSSSERSGHKEFGR